MKLHRIIPAVLAAIVMLPAMASAQQVRAATTVYGTARGFIGVLTEEVRTTSGVPRQRAVVDVVPGSPAEKAGVVKGDTIVRINGAAATSAVMATPYEPGDSITLRIRRNGRERDVRLVAGERQATYNRVELIPTEVNDRIRIIQDRIALMADTAKFPRLFIQRVSGDSQIVVFGTDTIRALRGTMALTFDTLHATMLRFPHDSVFAVLGGRGAGGSVFRTMPDSNMVLFRPAEIATGTFTFGMRAVAGAELHDVNPELGASFGVQRGVLVLNAREGTPAARAGLRGGDVIVRANGAEIGSITELRRAIEATRPGNPVQLRVVRRGQNVDISLNRN